MMSIGDYCLESTEDTDDPVDIWNNLRLAYAISVEAKIDGFLTDYCRVTMRADDSMNIYVVTSGSLENKLRASGHTYNDLDKMMTF